MNRFRTLAFAAIAAGTLAAGSAAFAQDAKKEEPRAQEQRHAHGPQHGDGMARMATMRERCQPSGQARDGEHKH